MSDRGYDSRFYQLAEAVLLELKGVQQADIRELAELLKAQCEEACDIIERREQP